MIITALATAGALFLNINDYENFLLLLGSVFVPMSAVLIVDYFLLSQGRWDLSDRAPSRWPMLVPWAAGFVMYQLINPGYISWWVSAWTWVAHRVGFSVESWMSASILSFVVSALATLVVGSLATAMRRANRNPAVGDHLGRPA